MIEFNFILNFLDLVFLQGDIFGIREGPLGSADPIVKGMLPSALAVIGFSIMLNLFNAGVRKKLVDSVKLKRIMKETKSWQKERMRAFRSKDEAKIAELSKKSKYMNKMSMEMMQMNMREKMAKDAAAGLGPYCNVENEIYLWAWYFLTAIAFSGMIMKITKTSMNE